VVVIESVAVETDAPFSVNGDGEAEHIAAAGAPVQLNETA
jgi:hypothetical protein